MMMLLCMCAGVRVSSDDEFDVPMTMEAAQVTLVKKDLDESAISRK